MGMASEAPETPPVQNGPGAVRRRKHVVILVHGIRDYALWQSTIRKSLESAGLQVELTSYMRVDLLRFLLPVEYFRRRIIDKIWTQIEFARKRHPDAAFSIIAHSFGTYVIAEILGEKFTMQAERVIFCGSVLKYDFPFEQIDSRFKGQIINEIGTADPWPALAESLTTGYGSAGTYGFRRPGVRDRWHNDATHSYFMTDSFCRKFWIPRLLSEYNAEDDNESIVEGDTSPKSPPWWVRLISLVKIKYLVSAVAIILFGIWMLRALFGSSFGYSLGQDTAQTFYWNAVVTQMVRDTGAVCPLPRAICSRPGLSLFLTQRRYVNVAEFDDKLKNVVSCSNFSWKGNDPATAIEAFAASFPQCVQLKYEEDNNSFFLRARPDGLSQTNDGRTLSCGCSKG
jgi:putative serine esterase DUF676